MVVKTIEGQTFNPKRVEFFLTIAILHYADGTSFRLPLHNIMSCEAA